MKEMKQLSVHETVLIETLKNLDYAFNKKGERDIEFVKFEMKIPKELNDTLAELISVLKNHYRGLDGHMLTKTSFIVANLMYILDRTADVDGKISSKNFYKTTHEQLFRSVIKDEVPMYAGLRKTPMSDEELTKSYEKYRVKTIVRKRKPKDTTAKK